VKNKFYSSLILWLGLSFATTTGYTKPTHHKHVSVSSKRTKAVKRHPVGRAKHFISDHRFSTVSKNLKRSKLYSLNRTRRLTKYASSDLYSDHFIANNNRYDTDFELSETKRVIHSIISTRKSSEYISNSRSYNYALPRHIRSVHGSIDASLSLSFACHHAGISDELIMQLTNIFGWDIDFANNLHEGDQFTVVYEESKNVNNSSESQIIAAEFVNQSRILTAIRYQDKEGHIDYYSPEGKPMRKSFLTTPVDFVRISSGFDGHRKHPILNRIRAHRGVDYAARTGTPVKSAGDGEVTFRGRKGGYGQVIIVKHGEHYETLYAHLSEFKNNLKNGDLVKQGEVIGYVGQTGLATGPHLHYEFLVDGIHQNPEKLNLAQSAPLDSYLLDDFKVQAMPLIAELNKTKAKSLFVKNQYDYN
jgi:murein DD-endopeptidase MepM/ murein hydrolase activator NlpD